MKGGWCKMADSVLLEAFLSGNYSQWNSRIATLNDIKEIDLYQEKIDWPNVDFKHFNFLYPVIFSGTEFVNNAVVLQNLQGNNKFHFDQCKFHKSLILAPRFQGSFNNAEFFDSISISPLRYCEFSGSKFHKLVKLEPGDYRNIYFSNTEFHSKIVAEECRFHKLLDFNSALFKDKVNFKGAIFEKEVYFKEASFQGEVQFTNTQFKGFTYLNSCKFKLAPDFQNAKFHEGTDFTNTEFQDVASPFAYNNYRTLKNKMNSLQAYYEANIFYALEQQSLLRKFRWRKDFWNIILLGVNHISNKHNQSWIRGVAFTLGIGFVFYFLFLKSIGEPISPSLNFDIERFGELAKKFWIFMNPLHSVDFLNTDSTSWSSFFDYVGRIFIGYGIYQTIQAFRKFGRK